RMARRRHVLEKRQTQPVALDQDWVCLDGVALAVTSELERAWPDRSPQWLALDRQPSPQSATARRWFGPGAQRRALLVRRQRQSWLAAFWSWLRRRPLRSTEE